MKHILIKLTIHEYMDMHPSYEHRLIQDTEEARQKVTEFIEHMNRSWSGGYYDKTIHVLSEGEARAFVNSSDIDPDSVDWAKEMLGID